jgi:hypothetical protein
VNFGNLKAGMGYGFPSCDKYAIVFEPMSIRLPLFPSLNLKLVGWSASIVTVFA